MSVRAECAPVPQVQFTKDSEQNLVLKGVDLEVKRGTLHMLLGPNGCGKGCKFAAGIFNCIPAYALQKVISIGKHACTERFNYTHAHAQSTLLKVLGGLVTPSSGSFTSDQPTGFVFQNPDHQVVMPTVAADVAFGLGRQEGACQADCRVLIRTVAADVALGPSTWVCAKLKLRSKTIAPRLFVELAKGGGSGALVSVLMGCRMCHHLGPECYERGSEIASLISCYFPSPWYDLPEKEVHAAVASALEVVNMSPYMHRATHTLSGGQRQRVAIA
eukprot:scaffold150997_cov20-Tisochrysis_lutea.AAC.5